MLNFLGVPLSIEGLCLQSKGDERVPGRNSKRVVVTCIISSAYLYIYMYKLNKNISKRTHSIKNTKSKINSYLYLHLCLEYSWWYGGYVWCICSPSNHPQDSVSSKKHTESLTKIHNKDAVFAWVPPRWLAHQEGPGTAGVLVDLKIRGDLQDASHLLLPHLRFQDWIHVFVV